MFFGTRSAGRRRSAWLVRLGDLECMSSNWLENVMRVCRGALYLVGG